MNSIMLYTPDYHEIMSKTKHPNIPATKKQHLPYTLGSFLTLSINPAINQRAKFISPSNKGKNLPLPYDARQ